MTALNIAERFTIIPCWDMEESDWLEHRKAGIGGSEIGVLAGLNHYDSPFALYHRKVNDISTFEGNEATELGHLLEGPVAERYAKVKNAAVVEWPVILQSKEHAFVSCNVDRFVVEPSEQFPAGVVTRWESLDEPLGIIGLLECKTGGIATRGKPEDWENNQIPASYWTQGVWYGGALGVPWIDYAALIGGHGVLYRRLEIDPQDWDNLLTIGRDFWENYVIPQVAPEPGPDNSSEAVLKKLYPREEAGKVLDANEEFMEAWNEFQEAKAAAEEADNVRKQARNKVVSLIGDADSVVFDGAPICTYRKSKDSIGLDKDSLKLAHPDIFQEFERVSEGSRRLVAK